MNAFTAPEKFETFTEDVAAGAVKLETRNLDFFYGKSQALHGVTIPFAANSVTAMIGPSGCCLLYTSPSPRDGLLSRMPSSA